MNSPWLLGVYIIFLEHKNENPVFSTGSSWSENLQERWGSGRADFAAALAFTRILSFAALVAGLATALAFAGILAGAIVGVGLNGVRANAGGRADGRLGRGVVG
jgi:hypothetical protein